MRSVRSKTFMICAIVAIALILVTALFAMLGWTGPVRGVLKTVVKPFEWVGGKAASALNGVVSVFTEYDRLAEENAALKEQIKELEDSRYDNEALLAENAWLKEYLNLTGSHADLLLTDARVVSRESGNYTTILTLNRGWAHGVKANMPVITSDGVFGYVKEAGLDWCKVVSIVETASSVGAYCDRTGAEGVVKGDVDLWKGGTCLMQYTKDADIRIGDRVYTAGGEGSLYPSGLLIGQVASIEADDVGLRVEIRPAVDFTDPDAIDRVMIIRGYATEG